LSGIGGIKQTILGVSGVVLVSKLLGFIREMVIAERFGTSLEYDIFLIAIAAPIFFNVVIVRSINFLLVPFLTRKLEESDSDSAYAAIWSVINSLMAAVLLVVLLLVIAAPYLVKLIGSDLTGEALSRAVFYCRAISILVFFGFGESVLRSALNVKKYFVYPSLGIIVLNITAISMIYIFSGQLSVAAILLGLVLGYFLQDTFLLLKLWNVRLFKYFNLRLFGSEVKKALSVGGVIIAVELLVSTYFLIDRYFASGLQEGVVSALNYCSLLVMLPVNIVALVIASVTFPYLSENAAEEKIGSFREVLHSALSMALVIGLPCGLFYLLFPADLTAAVFLRGAFDIYSLEITSNILITLAPYLVCLFIYTILIQACYSSGRQRTVFAVAVIAIALKALLTWLFKDIFGYPGIGLATSVVQIFTVLMLVWILIGGKRLGHIKELSITVAKVITASIPMLITGYFYGQMLDFSDGMSLISRLRVIPAGLISLAGFVIIGYLVKIDIIRDGLNKIIRRA